MKGVKAPWSNAKQAGRADGSPAFAVSAGGDARPGPIRVLVAEDCGVSRKLLCRLLEQHREIEIVGHAADGGAVVEQAHMLANRGTPAHVVLLDVEMPVMDGLTVLPLLMLLDPAPHAIMVSALTRRGASISVQALLRGAADVIAKPTGGIPTLDEFVGQLIFKIKALSRVVDDPRYSTGSRNLRRGRRVLPEPASRAAARHAGRDGVSRSGSRPAVMTTGPGAIPSASSGDGVATACHHPGLARPLGGDTPPVGGPAAVDARAAPSADRLSLRADGRAASAVASARDIQAAQRRPGLASSALHDADMDGGAGRPRAVPDAAMRSAPPVEMRRSEDTSPALRRRGGGEGRPDGAASPPAAHAAITSSGIRIETGRPGSIRGHGPIDVVAIGSSTGGPQALLRLLQGLDNPLNVPVVMTQHMQQGFTAILAEQLQRQAGRPVREAVDGEILMPNVALLAPGDRHMLIDADGDGLRVRLCAGAPVHFCRPAVDPMLLSLAACHGKRVLAAILTGMGMDGADGCAAILATGGRIIIQDRATSVVWGMPGAVAARDLPRTELPIDEIGQAISRICATSKGMRHAGGG